MWATRSCALGLQRVAIRRANAFLLPSKESRTLQLGLRSFAANKELELKDINKLRNFGISAHIDSGKTTLTERVLFYTGMTKEIHEVGGKDEVGAKMDSMDLEREKGITIKSAATYCNWGDHAFNIIDTPGHVDFTIEVERALRVLDGAIMLVCASSGVQSQTMTVDTQMKRYNVPRIAFVNKLDRLGADPWKCINQMRDNLGLHAAALQLPIGVEKEHRGVVCLLTKRAIYFDGPNGEFLRYEDEIPAHLTELYDEKRAELIATLADADEEMEELYLMEEEPTLEQMKAAIRRATLSHKFVAVLMGSAYKNKGVQPLLDAVVDYLPKPTERINTGLDQDNDEAPVTLETDASKPAVYLAFKLEEGKFGQVTYCRIYQGTITKGDSVIEAGSKKKAMVPKLVKMHSNEMHEVTSAKAGEIVAMYGLDCSSGTTFCEPPLNVSMTSIHVPDAVISLAVKPKAMQQHEAFSKAIARFVKEDPTFRVFVDPESNETILSGMGELHLEIYCERLNREYGVEVVTGQPQVAYRETIGKKVEFNYLHKKQSGGRGQYGRVIGYIEPLEEGNDDFIYENKCVGNNIPPEFYAPIKKGFEDAQNQGCNIGHPVQGVRVVLQDGAAHVVDSSEIAFRTAALHGFQEAMRKASPTILEPIMKVDVSFPTEFQNAVVTQIIQRKGMIENVTSGSGAQTVAEALVPLANMFGYSSELRSSTEGKGEFAMVFDRYMPVMKTVQEELIKAAQEKRKAK